MRWSSNRDEPNGTVQKLVRTSKAKCDLNVIVFCLHVSSIFYFYIAPLIVKSRLKNTQYRFQCLQFVRRPTQLDDESVIRFRES